MAQICKNNSPLPAKQNEKSDKNPGGQALHGGNLEYKRKDKNGGHGRAWLVESSRVESFDG
jgi:hypothetical protein